MAIAGRIEEVIEIPEGVEVNVEGQSISVKSAKVSLERTFEHPKIRIEKKDQALVVSCEYPRKKEKAMVGTVRAHINNMIKGVTNGFEYRMKIVYSHFPIKAGVRDDRFVIENFLGEKHPRYAQLIGDTKVTVKGDLVTLTGPNKEHVGQSAVNIENATRIKGYDPRVFQDGIYIVNKGR